MRNIFTKLFKKDEKEKIPADGFNSSWKEIISERSKEKKDIIVKTDVAFHRPASKVIEEIKSNFKDTDYSKLEFEEYIEDFNLKALSPEAKKLIIQIIKEDNKSRESKIKTYAADGSLTVKFPPADLSKQPQQYGIDTKTKKVVKIDESTKDTVVSFSEYGKILETEQGEGNLKNKEQLLYKLVATYFPGNTHEQIIEFIKQNLEINEIKD